MKKIQYNTIKKLCLSGFLGATAIFLSGFEPVYSQTPQVTILNGTTVKITSGSSLNSSENFVLNTGGSLDVKGTLILKKNFINQNNEPDSLGSGAVIFSGTANQSVSGQNIINNLELDNSTGLTVLGNTKVFGALALTNGLVTLGDFNLLLGSAATVTGTPGATKMVVATGTGELRKEYASAGSFTFPVGAADTPPEYAPVTITYNSGTFATGNYTGVNLKDIQYPGTDISYLTMYWNVSQSGVTNFTSNAKFQYNSPADVHGTESDIYCTKVLPAPWIVYNAANTGSHYLDFHGLTSFGTFTGNLGNGSTPPDIRSIQDQTITTGPLCADANQTLLIAGNGTTYLVHTGGIVHHIARTNIIYYPGTKVDGGYLHGEISTIFCNPPPIISAPIVSGVENPGIISDPNNSFFKIYPNPTPGKFTLELNGDVTSAKVHVEIFGVLGDKILSKDMQIDRKQEFSLIEKPTGVYIVHVTSGVISETEKIIKR